MNSAIRVESLRKVFGRGAKRFVAVDDLSLDVEAGQVYGFLGPNGAGKSTTIRMILALSYPSSGFVSVFGNAIPRSAQVLQERVGALVDGASRVTVGIVLTAFWFQRRDVEPG